MRDRLLVTIVLVPIGIMAIHLGGWIFTIIIGLFLAAAAWEYSCLFQASGYQPSRYLVVGGVLLLLITRTMSGLASTPGILSLLILVSMTYHLIAYERGRDQAATDFTITLGGILYLGFIGSYLVSLRSLPAGKWWLLIVFPAVWLADSGAYLIGSAWGKHSLSPRLSPKKTWEGYFGGIVFGTVFTTLLTLIWQIGAGPESGITLGCGIVIGLVMGAFPTLGDLGESMIKRQAHAKDSGNLIPGHGGAFDRIDSWLWAGVIGYYLITWLWV